MAADFEYDVFLSHSSKDKPAVRELAQRLKGDGLRVWLDDWVIQPGDSIPLAIEQGLENSRTLVLVMSKNAFASDWVTLERHTALFRDPTNQQRRFIPLRLDDANIKDSLKHFAYVDWREPDEASYQKLLGACQAAPTKARVLVEADDSKGVYIGRKIDIMELTNHGNTALISFKGLSSITAYDLDTGACIGTLEGHSAQVLDIAVAEEAPVAVSASVDNTVRVWDLATFTCRGVLKGHVGSVVGVSVTPNGECAISGSYDRTLRVWNTRTLTCDSVLTDHTRSILGTSVRLDGRHAVSYSRDGTVRTWDLISKKCLTAHEGVFDDYEDNRVIKRIAVTANCKKAVSSWRDGTLRVWDLETGQWLAILEGHTKPVVKAVVTPDGRNAFSFSEDRTIRSWDIESGQCLETTLVPGFPSDIAATPNGKRVVFPVDLKLEIIDYRSRLPVTDAIADVTQYTNAKVLLVGDSGVGKSGLAIRLTESKFKPTVSTDAHWATQLRLPHDANTEGIEREIWLWDFAGQADYRLIHQLFMDETALAVLVFNPQSENPFEGLRQWDRDLTRAARREFAKLLVAGRCDRGRLMVSRQGVEEFAVRRSFAAYLETSALTADGCERLRDEIVRQIHWDSIPWTASPRIFKLLKDEILRLRDEGVVLLRMGELKQQLQMRLVKEAFTVEELRAVVGLLAGPGLVWKLEFGDVVILQPEWINKYAAAVIRSVRAHIGEIGVIDEARVLAGDLNYTVDVVRREADDETETVKVEMQRLDPSDEAIVLRAMHQMFVDHGLCVREELEGGGRQLIFPSYFKQELPTDPGHPPVLVNYQFDGHAETIYATLVGQLWRTKAFENGDLWRYAADFKSQTGARLGLKMVRHEGKNPEISVYFDSEVQDDTKVTFIKYVHEHLLEKAQDVVRLRAFVCPHCGHPVRDTQLAREILDEEGARAEIRCQQRKCDKRFSLWDVIEQKFASEKFQERVRELEEKAKAAIDNESRELILEGHARVITGEAGQIYRGYTGSDHGIDGEIEFKDDSGQAGGKRLYLQLKSGDSYLYRRKSDGAEVFQIKKQRWATYWRAQAYPVMLVIRTSDGQIRWMNVTEYLEEKSKGRKTPVKQIVFDGQPFTALNLQRLRDRLIPV